MGVHTGWFSSWFSLGRNGHQPKTEFSATLRTFVLTFHCRSLPMFGLSCRSLCLTPQVVSGSGQASAGSASAGSVPHLCHLVKKGMELPHSPLSTLLPQSLFSASYCLRHSTRHLLLVSSGEPAKELMWTTTLFLM